MGVHGVPLCPGAACSPRPLATRCPSLRARLCPGVCQSHLPSVQSREEKSCFGTIWSVGTPTSALRHLSPGLLGLATPTPFLGSSHLSPLWPKERALGCFQTGECRSRQPGRPGQWCRPEGWGSPSLNQQGRPSSRGVGRSPTSGPCPALPSPTAFHCRSLSTDFSNVSPADQLCSPALGKASRGGWA